MLFAATIGSQAHGLARPDSDTDTRSVYALPTELLLSMHSDSVKKAWQTVDPNGDDAGGYEVVRWLELMAKCSPSAIELAYAPRELYPEGAGLQELGRTLISRKPFINAMIGYAMNSWRKIEERPGKWKAGILRTLFLAHHVADQGPTSPAITLDVREWPLEQLRLVRRARDNQLSDGVVWDLAKELKGSLESTEWPNLPEKLSEDIMAAANDWLVRLRVSLLR